MIRKSAAGDVPESAWFKSSYSDGPDGDSCVEVANTSGVTRVRDSKQAAGPQLAFAPEAWAAFVRSASEG